MQKNVLLIVTLGFSYKAAVTAILDKDPEFVSIICTPQSQENIEKVQQDLEDVGHSMPQLFQLGKTVVAHDNVQEIYQAIKPLFLELKRYDFAVYLDLTSGTVPMSIGAWEASKLLDAVIVSWIDHVIPPRIHMLSITE